MYYTKIIQRRKIHSLDIFPTVSYCANLLNAHTYNSVQSIQMEWRDVIKFCIIRTEMSYISEAGINMTGTDSALQQRKLDLPYQEDATKISWNYVSLQFCPMTSPLRTILDCGNHSLILTIVCRASFPFWHYRDNHTVFLVKIYS